MYKGINSDHSKKVQFPLRLTSSKSFLDLFPKKAYIRLSLTRTKLPRASEATLEIFFRPSLTQRNFGNLYMCACWTKEKASIWRMVPIPIPKILRINWMVQSDERWRAHKGRECQLKRTKTRLLTGSKQKTLWTAAMLKAKRNAAGGITAWNTRQARLLIGMKGASNMVKPRLPVCGSGWRHHTKRGRHAHRQIGTQTTKGTVGRWTDSSSGDCFCFLCWQRMAIFYNRRLKATARMPACEESWLTNTMQ